MAEKITDKFAVYNSDCVPGMEQLPDESIDFSIYSPPFGGDMYNYSSDPADHSNVIDYGRFLEQYGFVVEQIARVSKPGRLSAVHCIDIPGRGDGPDAKTGCGANVGTGLIDFPGDIIRIHRKHGMHYCGRRGIWKEPLGVRNRTMAKGLAHMQIVEDSTLTDVASMDYLLMFRKIGENKTPVSHPTGLDRYYGERKIPAHLYPWKNWDGDQTQNLFSHWIWRQYASSFWDDIRIEYVLKYDIARDVNDEKHPHPLQRDVIARAVILNTNPGETVLTPYMGVGSEVYESVLNGRKAIGWEIKPTYFAQTLKNLGELDHPQPEQESLNLSPAPETLI